MLARTPSPIGASVKEGLSAEGGAIGFYQLGLAADKRYSLTLTTTPSMELRTLLTGKTLRFVGITVALGAIGSGAWEWMLKPFIMGASEFGLNVATLGMRSFKDSLYRDIALGLHEESSLRLHTAVFFFLPLFMLGFATGSLRFRTRKSKAEIEATTLDRVMEKLIRPMLVIFIFLIVFSVVQANQLTYINRAVTHFHQLLAIVGPYVREEERVLYKSQFAQISSGDDYAKLTTTLENICRAKSLKVPAFVVW